MLRNENEQERGPCSGTLAQQEEISSAKAKLQRDKKSGNDAYFLVSTDPIDVKICPSVVTMVAVL